MVPDWGFTKQLKKLDPDYDVVWDWGSSRWEIWKKDVAGVPYHVLTVETKNKTYRELGADILLKLQQIRSFDYDDMIAYIEEMDIQNRRRLEQDFRNKLQAIARDTFINIHCKVIQVPRALSIQRGLIGQ